MKYGHRDLRNVLERSYARETTVRVAVGAVAKALLNELGIQLYAHVTEIGGVKADTSKARRKNNREFVKLLKQIHVYCVDPEASAKMVEAIDDTKKAGDSIGGVVEVIVEGMPAGIGIICSL